MLPLITMFHDINDAYCDLQTQKSHYCEWENTRNGMALAFQMPILITHASPYRRVLFDPIRDANPFFHYMEAIWMLSGSQNVDFPAMFASNIKNYSDDGVTLHGAYGHRWRYHFENDQLEEVIELLQKDHKTRRAVLTMWDPSYDLGADTKDLPCNTHIYFRIIKRYLNMTVCNRSNDLVWGALGANAVHFSILHEYVANAVEVNLGEYHQFTNNLHVYEEWVDRYTKFPSRWYRENPHFDRWEFGPDNIKILEAEQFVEQGLDSDEQYRCRIIRDNAVPMLQAWLAYKDGDLHLALHHARGIHDADWQEACIQWLERRKEKQNGGE